MYRILVICGPTASGKTALAVELAEKLDAEIVSADSQQCYRGLDAATAKPTAAEQARARHHLLDIEDPEEQLDAAQFAKLADAAIAAARARGGCSNPARCGMKPSGCSSEERPRRSRSSATARWPRRSRPAISKRPSEK